MAGDSGSRARRIASEVTPWTAAQQAAVASSTGARRRPALAIAATHRRKPSYDASAPGVGRMVPRSNIKR